MLTAAAFLLLFLALAVLALARHPAYGLYLYLAVFYIHPPSRWWSANLPDLRWSLFAAAVALLAFIIHRKKLPVPETRWYATTPGTVLLAFVGWLWIQNLWALDGPTHLSASIQYTKYIVVFYLVYRLASNAAESVDILLAHVAGCFYLGLLAFSQGRGYGGRLDGVGGPGIDDANTLGMFLATGVIIGAMLFLAVRGWRRVAIVLMMPIILNGLILTGSRGAFLGLLTGGAIVFYLCPPERRWVFWGAAMLGVVLAVRLVDQTFIDRMLTIREAVREDGQIDSSAEGRLVLIEAQFRMAARYPYGAGHRGTAVLSPQYLDRQWLTLDDHAPEAPPARSSHNTFMSLLVEQGIPGVVIYAWLGLWGVRTVRRLRSMQRAGTPVELTGPAIAACGGMAVVWVAGQFADYLLAEVQIWLFAVLAISLAQLSQLRDEAATDASSPAPTDDVLGGSSPGQINYFAGGSRVRSSTD